MRRPCPLSLLLITLIGGVSTSDDGGRHPPAVRTTLVPAATLDEELPRPQASVRDLPPLEQIRVETGPPVGRLPGDLSADFFPGKTVPLDDVRQIRDWPVAAYHWESTGLCHRPLYFEDRCLEQHGCARAPLVQPLFSGARLFGGVTLLPLKILGTCRSRRTE